ncbi:DUF2791 family P-loop domain-containing protein [Bacillaceae bacterium S4-13-58]
MSTQEKKWIEAFRLGVVPKNLPPSLQILYDNVFTQISRDLKELSDDGGIVRWICGPYGSGKTLLSKQIQQFAKRNGFVTSSFSLSDGLKLHHLDHWYYGTLHHLSAQINMQEVKSFHELFNQWIQSLRSQDNVEDSTKLIKEMLENLNFHHHSFSHALNQYIRARLQKDIALATACASWLSGEREVPQHIKEKLEVKGSVSKENSLEFFQGFMTLIKWLSFRGMVLIIDEAELLLRARSDLRQRAYENIRQMIDWVYDGTLPNLSIIWLTTPELLENQEKGISTYDALAQRIQLLDWQKRENIHSSSCILSLHQIGEKEIDTLANEIVSIYCTGYSFSCPVQPKSIGNWALLHLKQDGVVHPFLTVRRFVQQMIKILDIIRENPTQRYYQTELERSSYNGTHLFTNK